MPPPTEGFFPAVYDELKRLAAARLASERAGHSLDATALVHEAYLRLGDAAFADRSGFFRAAAVAMQRILVDHARAKRAGKRGGGARTVVLEGDAPTLGPDPDLLLDIDEALSRLATEDPSSADVARYRLFAGLSIDEAAEAMGVLASLGVSRVGLRPVVAGDGAGFGGLRRIPKGELLVLWWKDVTAKAAIFEVHRTIGSSKLSR